MSTAITPDAGVDVRPLTTERDLAACIELQRVIWGPAHNAASLRVLQVAPKIGGVAAGAFDAQDRLLGFVFGLSGIRECRLVHWSLLLGVRREARDMGLGRRLKEFQRQTVAAHGAEIILWTYDPLVARNAYLNVVKLGARPVEYVRNMYGENSGSAIHPGIGTDRFIVAWHIGRAAPPDVEPIGDAEAAAAPIVNVIPGRGRSTPPVSDAPVVRVCVPASIDAVYEASLTAAAAWRASTRRALEEYLGRGYRIAEFRRGPDDESDAHYLLTRAAAPADER